MLVQVWIGKLRHEPRFRGVHSPEVDNIQGILGGAGRRGSPDEAGHSGGEESERESELHFERAKKVF